MVREKQRHTQHLKQTDVFTILSMTSHTFLEKEDKIKGKSKQNDVERAPPSDSQIDSFPNSSMTFAGN